MKSLNTRAAACAMVLCAAALSACVPAALVGGAVGAGALLMTAERRSSQTQEDDRRIEADAQQSVVQALAGRGHVNISSYYRKALLTGEVPSEQDRQMVAARVAAIPGVASVVNELAVMPESSPWQRSNDGLITSRVRARLMNQNGVPSGSVLVVTERGTTYLMGRLTPQETELATEVTRQTEGVQRVVRVIDLIADPAGAGSAAAPALPAAGTTATPPAAGELTEGVVVSPVVQPDIAPATPAVEVRTLPPATAP